MVGKKQINIVHQSQAKKGASNTVNQTANASLNNNNSSS